MSGQKSDNLPLGVRSLRGLGSGDHTMDVIVAGKRHGAQEHVIFFGGDVQDYPENMESHRDNGRYVRWNLLETAERLCERFPSALVLVMKPHHMHLKTFSVYSQFVQSNNFGVPTHTPNYGAWERLVSVYEEAVGIVLGPARSRNDGVNCNQNGCGGSDAGAAAAVSEPPVQESGDSKTSSPPPDQDTEQQSPAGCLPQDVSAGESQSANRDSDSLAASSVSPLLDVPVHLVAFSKGCIVLNQLLQELNALEKNQAVHKFVLRVRTMTWLDGGHSGGSNTWVTDPGALERLAALGVEIHVHVTPYQVKDEMRVWIGKEKRRFVELLQKAGANVHDTLHFDNEPKSIENHFRVLEVF
ncbi:mitochondrial protein C2orf69 homolog isoform X2 [Littorina saxatilis]